MSQRRRSSRARTTQPSQPPPEPPTHTNSSTSTTSLNRGERSTRSNNRLPSPRDISVQRSESMEDADSMALSEPVQPRRSRRGNETEKEDHIQKQDQDEDEELADMEEEVTRCICGQADYPGPPPSVRDRIAQDGTAEDIGNFFIQCDKCHVWQHAGCMGILETDESLAPENYYCEQCRPESHQVKTSSHPPRSVYLPVQNSTLSRSSSLSTSHEQLSRKDSKDSRADAVTKRRATMNSRGAYDEDEALRRAIEESKGEQGTLGKRTRDEVDDVKQNTKRQRTNSTSPSSLSKRSRSPSQAPDQEGSSRADTNGPSTQKSRATSVRTNIQKEIFDQDRARTAAMRAEAANKRNARSERRRGDDSPPPTPSLSPSKAVQPSRKSNGNGNGNGNSNGHGSGNDPSPSHKSNINNLRKTGRPTARRGRLGRNQYTRDQPANGESNGNTPLRDTSHDPNGNSGSPPGGAHGINGESGRSSKAKTHPARTSMNEMKRRVAAILEFVGRMQTERTPNSNSQQTSGSGSEKGANTPNGVIASSLPTAGLVRAIEATLRDVPDNASSGSAEEMAVEKEFERMASGEMMESLTRELVGWQHVYGKYGEK